MKNSIAILIPILFFAFCSCSNSSNNQPQSASIKHEAIKINRSVPVPIIADTIDYVYCNTKVFSLTKKVIAMFQGRIKKLYPERDGGFFIGNLFDEDYKELLVWESKLGFSRSLNQIDQQKEQKLIKLFLKTPEASYILKDTGYFKHKYLWQIYTESHEENYLSQGLWKTAKENNLLSFYETYQNKFYGYDPKLDSTRVDSWKVLRKDMKTAFDKIRNEEIENDPKLRNEYYRKFGPDDRAAYWD